MIELFKAAFKIHERDAYLVDYATVEGGKLIIHTEYTGTPDQVAESVVAVIGNDIDFEIREILDDPDRVADEKFVAAFNQSVVEYHSHGKFNVGALIGMLLTVHEKCPDAYLHSAEFDSHLELRADHYDTTLSMRFMRHEIETDEEYAARIKRDEEYAAQYKLQIEQREREQLRKLQEKYQ